MIGLIKTTRNCDLPDGKYLASMYGWKIEVAGIELDTTEIGLRCPKESALKVNVIVKNKEIFHDS